MMGAKQKVWQAPADMDAPCVALCAELNARPGVRTTCSCCGHGKTDYNIWFNAPLRALPDILYFFDG